MKLRTKSIITLIAMLLSSIGALAQTPGTLISYKLDGEDSNAAATGIVECTFSGTTATIVCKPIEGNYITADDITVYKTVNGSKAQTRETGIESSPVAITAASTNTTPRAESSYTFTAEEDPNLTYEITANFHALKDLSTDAQITLTPEGAKYTYTGQAIEPEFTVTVGDKELEANTDYTFEYANNVNVGKGSITITATTTTIYTGSKTVTFDIDKADVSFWFENADGSEPQEDMSITIGETFTEPTLKMSEEGAADVIAVNYSVDKESVATINATTGKLTILTPGTVVVTAAAAQDYTKMENSNYNASPEDTKATYSLTIKKIATELKFSKETATATMNAEFEAPTLTKTPENLEGVEFTSSNTAAATVDKNTGAVTLEGGGETTIKAAFAGSDTYEAAEASYVLTVNNATMTVSATGFEGAYDKEAHGITVTVTSPEGAVVKYGTTEGTYDLTENPTYTDAGTYTVYYQVTKDSYETTTGSATVKISKATPTVTAPTAKENLTYTGEAQELISAGSTTGGELQYSLDNETYSTNIPKGTEAKEYTVYYKVVGGTNYEDVAAASIKVTISEAAPEKMTVSATGFEGAYDKEAHSITVTVTSPEGAVVKYGTTEGTYDLTENPTYTEAGTYTVYYQVTKDGYETTTGSATVKINKAKPTVTAPTAKENLTYTGEAQELISAGSTTGGELQYSLDNATYSKNIPTGTEVNEYTVYYKVIGGTNYEDVAAASIKVTISRAAGEGYLLWVNDTQVTSDNAEDVLGHTKDSSKPYYIFYKDENKLTMDNDQTRTTVIESRMPELTVYIKDANKIKRIFFNNTGDTSNKGNLTFTTNGNFPGKLIIANPTKGESAIKGFSNISYKWDLTAIEPDGSYYDTTTLKMMYKDETEAIVIADTITIGEAIVPITEKRAITFEESQLVEKDEDGKVKKDESGNPIKANLSNYSYAPASTTGEPEKNVIHISLNSANISDDAGGFDIENGVGGIYIEDTMTDEKAGQVAQDVNDNKIVPGGTLYAERYDGFTFKLIAGSGTIEIDEIVENDHEFHLIIGINKPITLNESNSIIWPYDGKSVRVQAEIAFNVGAPTYCFLYMVKKTAGTRGTRLGKRDKAHGKLVSVQVRSTTVIPTEPPSEATGGVIPKSDDPEPETDPTPPTGIREVKSDKMAVKSGWYTIDGQKIAEPTQRGLYIKDGRKVVIK